MLVKFGLILWSHTVEPNQRHSRILGVSDAYPKGAVVVDVLTDCFPPVSGGNKVQKLNPQYFIYNLQGLYLKNGKGIKRSR